MRAIVRTNVVCRMGTSSSFQMEAYTIGYDWGNHGSMGKREWERIKQRAKGSGCGWSGFAAAGSLAPEERGDLVAIAANGHGAPAAAVGTRVIVEEEAARGIGANADRCVGAFDDQFGGRTRNGGEEPLEAAFPGDEFQTPAFGAGNKF